MNKWGFMKNRTVIIVASIRSLSCPTLSTRTTSTTSSGTFSWIMSWSLFSPKVDYIVYQGDEDYKDRHYTNYKIQKLVIIVCFAAGITPVVLAKVGIAFITMITVVTQLLHAFTNLLSRAMFEAAARNGSRFTILHGRPLL